MILYVSLMVTAKQKPTINTEKDKEKGIKVYHYRKSLIHKGRQQKRKK